MAKKGGGPEKRFKFPKFDREAFLTKEIRDAKISYLSLGLAGLLALLSLIVAAKVHVGLAVLIGFTGPISLRWLIPAIGIDTSEFERKNWMGPGLVTFFVWLGMCILFTNPPFQDIAHPTIDHYKIYQQEPESGNWTVMERAQDPDIDFKLSNGTFVIVARMLDNWELEKVEMTLKGEDSTRSPEMLLLDQNNTYEIRVTDKDDGHIYHVHFVDLESGSYTMSITVWDSRENSKTERWTLVIE